MAAELVSGFDLCLAQSERDGERLRALGGSEVRVAGNLKFAATPLPVDETELTHWKRAFDGRPRWLAASTHPGEEAFAARVHVALARTYPDLLTVIVPRHPDRGAAIEEELRASGLRIVRRSQHREARADTQVYLADTFGELGLWYRFCPLTLIGKSLLNGGGQNPIEPAILGCAVLFGPHMDNFEPIATELAQCGAARRFVDEADLVNQLLRCLNDRGITDAMGAAGRAFAMQHGNSLGMTMDSIRPFLERLPPSPEVT